MTIAQKIRTELHERDDIFDAHRVLRDAANSVETKIRYTDIEFWVYVFADSSTLSLAKHTDYAGNIGQPND
jgi:hypothetical protein